MKELTLYTTQDARRTMESKKITGLNASILKWQMVEIALNEVFDNINSNCGLCIEGVISIDAHAMCERCPVDKIKGQQCPDDTSNYARTKFALHDAIFHASRVLRMLNDIKHRTETEVWNAPEIGWGRFQDHFEDEYNKAWRRLLSEQPKMLDSDRIAQSCDIASAKTLTHIKSLNIEVKLFDSTDKSYPNTFR